MITWDELCDGQEHNLRLGVDFGPLVGRVVEWVPIISTVPLVPGEDPVYGWLNVDPNCYTVEQGWATVAVWLQNMAKAHGVQMDIAQYNTVDKKTNIVQAKRFVVRRLQEEEF